MYWIVNASDISEPDSEQMVPCTDFLAETKEVRGVVVEDMALLLFDRNVTLVGGNRTKCI
jgi:hypothetical protein